MRCAKNKVKHISELLVERVVTKRRPPSPSHAHNDSESIPPRTRKKQIISVILLFLACVRFNSYPHDWIMTNYYYRKDQQQQQEKQKKKKLTLSLVFPILPARRFLFLPCLTIIYFICFYQFEYMLYLYSIFLYFLYSTVRKANNRN